ncbi:MAG TPA: hypothetical protein VMI31_07825 [Fimbriimonadaceae bacterium]|nr:hypothetical protein [Fimbriimonadaceae bacterium]
MVAAFLALALAQTPTVNPGWVVAFQRDNGIWVSRADGHGLRKIVAKGQDPRWSPDGKRLAYYRDGAIHVFSFAARKDALAGAVHCKPDSFMNRCYIDWDPRTPIILCASISGDGIQLIGADEGNTILKAEGVTYCPRWSPSGRELAFARDGDIWLAHRDLHQIRMETFDYYGNANRLAPLAMFNDAESGGSAETPFWVDELEWTRDERRLVFHFQRQGGSGVSEIGYLDLRRTRGTLHSNISGFSYATHWILGKDRMAFSPAICPDGETLSYVAIDDNGDLSLYVCAWDGSHRRRILRDVENPDWRPVLRTEKPQ